MDSDDIFSPILGRRDILRTAGALGVLSLARIGLRGATPAWTPSPTPQDIDFSDLADNDALQAVCSMTPAEIEGPYYLNLNLVRSDITEGLPGLHTRLFLHVVHASDCTPIPNATVDVWHADALGRYSGIASQGTQGQTFLRGVQFTDAAGTAVFDTVYPGWYPGRTAHIHVKVRPTATSVLTTQMYFKQRLTNRVYGLPPYNTHAGNPTPNTGDGLYLPATLMSVLMTARLNLELTIGVA